MRTCICRIFICRNLKFEERSADLISCCSERLLETYGCKLYLFEERTWVRCETFSKCIFVLSRTICGASVKAPLLKEEIKEKAKSRKRWKKTNWFFAEFLFIVNGVTGGMSNVFSREWQRVVRHIGVVQLTINWFSLEGTSRHPSCFIDIYETPHRRRLAYAVYLAFLHGLFVTCWVLLPHFFNILSPYRACRGRGTQRSDSLSVFHVHILILVAEKSPRFIVP